MGRKNKYKEIVGLPLAQRIVRQNELVKEMNSGKFLEQRYSSNEADYDTPAKEDQSPKKKTKTKEKTKEKSIEDESNGGKFKSEGRKKRKSDAERSMDRPKKSIDDFGGESKKKKRKIESPASNTIDQEKSTTKKSKNEEDDDLKSKMVAKLIGARFRYINEILYTTSGGEAKELFENDPGLFEAYHDGYRSQNKKWPFDPLTNVIKQLNRSSSNHMVADMGCGEARLAKSVKQTVHSFDLVAINDRVTQADIAEVPLEDGSIDTCVFCLSLMGTNIADYIGEANRILKKGGLMKIVEIRSRFESIGRFKRAVEKMGFDMKKEIKLPDDYFIQMDFEKTSNTKKTTRAQMKDLTLKPCLYKKR